MEPKTRHSLFQTSLMSALLDGVYEDEMTVDELLDHGSFGIGTFNGLDGEMVVVDGKAYQLRGDGSVQRAAGNAESPYAVVTNFVPMYSMKLADNVTRSIAHGSIDELIDSPNYMYALRITGHFSAVTTRTVTRQEKPYRPMTQATDDDAVLEFTDTTGTIVGFRTPLYEQGIGVPGCHAHYISDDRTQGGHLLDFTLAQGTVELCLCTDLHLRLPLTHEFRKADLMPEDLAHQLEKTEVKSASATAKTSD
ncbi:acetolactate decarboxylase [Propionibacterium sp.]|uniref:acetolactate decarboxylase n=1 Tax=Propionibacterium sp. TaxID=1977903 RepID=UPI0039E9011E